MRFRFLGLWLLLLPLASAALAGPPFDTDDPDPTDTGHWELYVANTLDGRGSTIDGEFAFEANYGAARNLQLSLGLPYDYAHNRAEGSRNGAGDIELSAKYRFLDDEQSGFSMAAFPAVTIPTGAGRFTNHRMTVTLPLWAQLERSPWALFGGGGYVVNPGPGNHDYWTAGAAVLRQVGDRLSIGAELTREGRGDRDDHASTGAGLGVVYRLDALFSILLRGGPVFEDGGKASYHSYAAVGLNF